MHWIKEIMAKVDRIVMALEHADKCGTRDQPDRSKQYPLNTEKQIIDAVNLALTKARQNEKAIASKADNETLRKQLRDYRIANTALTAILTGLAWEGVKALISFFFR